MSLTRDDWVKLLAPIVLGTDILVPFGQILIKEWYQPFVQYGTGGAYIHPKLAVANMQLKNWGSSDAANVAIMASFASPITNFNSDRMTTPFESSTGGIGQKDVMGTIKRLAPGETVNIYFTIEPSSPWVDQRPVIREIKFDGGQGKERGPYLRSWGLAVAVGAVFAGVWSLLMNFMGRRQRVRYLNYLTEAIQRGHSARQEGLSDGQLRARVEEWHKNISLLTRPRLDTLMTCAQAAFTGGNLAQTPGPTS
jgi:hypothetical protein